MESSQNDKLSLAYSTLKPPMVSKGSLKILLVFYNQKEAIISFDRSKKFKSLISDNL